MKTVKKTKKPLTQLQIQHQKFLKKMGVTPKQLKDRKKARQDEENGIQPLRLDSLSSINKAYEKDNN